MMGMPYLLWIVAAHLLPYPEGTLPIFHLVLDSPINWAFLFLEHARPFHLYIDFHSSCPLLLLSSQYSQDFWFSSVKLFRFNCFEIRTTFSSLSAHLNILIDLIITCHSDLYPHGTNKEAKVKSNHLAKGWRWNQVERAHISMPVSWSFIVSCGLFEHHGRLLCGKAWLLHAIRNSSQAGRVGSNLELPLGREGPFHMGDYLNLFLHGSNLLTLTS